MMHNISLFQVEDARSKDELLNLLTELQDEMIELSGNFAAAYQSRNYSAAKDYLVKMKYISSIENTTKEKILKCDSSSN